MQDWYDNDLFWEKTAAFMFDQNRWENTPAEVDHMITLLGLETNGTLLDLCCGPGRHSLEFARRGFQVTGVDRTAAYLKQAQTQASTEDLKIEFIQADMRTFRRTEAFDAAIVMFTAFGYFEDQADNQKVLKNLADSLNPGGRLILDVSGKEILARIFRERDWEEQDGLLILEERKISQNWRKIENRWIVIKDTERHDFRFSLWIYSAAELTAMLMEAGFSSVRIYGSLVGDPYDHEARRLIAVAQK